MPGIEILGRGGLLGVLGPGKEAVAELREKHRVLVGGCPGNPRVLRIIPALTTTDVELDIGLRALREVLA